VNGFCDLASTLARDGDCDLLLLGGPREYEFNQAILKRCGAILKDTGCSNPLEEFTGIISLCDVVVSSDSLAAHVAIALKKHVAIFFGPTCSQEVDLYGRGVKIVTDFPCAPCYLKICSRLPNCMEKLDAKRVYEAVRLCLNDIKSSRM
jgi:heptosyltransferase-2